MQTAAVKQTHIENQKQQALSLKQQCCHLLGWDELQYATFQWETGCEYLQHYIKDDTWGRQMLEENRTYWNWWKNQWTLRDEEFLSKVRGGDPEAARMFYAEYHDARTLAEEIYPNGVVLGMSYKGMIQQLIDEINQPA